MVVLGTEKSLKCYSVPWDGKHLKLESPKNQFN